MNIEFLRDDIEVGLLKNKRAGMIRRTLKFTGGCEFNELIYLPYFRDFIVLRVKGRFE